MNEFCIDLILINKKTLKNKDNKYFYVIDVLFKDVYGNNSIKSLFISEVLFNKIDFDEFQGFTGVFNLTKDFGLTLVDIK